MNLSSLFAGCHPEPPPWLYNLMARGPIARRIYQRFTADLAASLAPGARLLDVGTGPGYLLRHLAQVRPDLHLCGLDFDYRMIRLARRAPTPAAATWVVADAQALPFPAGAFNQAVASLSLHIWPDPVQGMKEMRRVLTREGRAWIYEMNREASAVGIRAFAREVGVPFLVLYPGVKLLGRHHGLTGDYFAALLRDTGVAGWELRQVHDIFWRGELVS